MVGRTRREGWTLGDAPSLDGRVAIVTGATGGIGYETALGLARRGATTILAGRNATRGGQAVAAIRRLLPHASARYETLDLGRLDDVARFAGVVQDAHPTIDILVNNAGIMGTPQRQQTVDGFERQLGVNYLGHFALTARLRQALCRADGGGRVVNVASVAHRRASLDLDDLQLQQGYTPMGAYGRTKLAMLIFTIELQRHAVQHGWNLRAVAAHPGWARTEIVANGPGGGAPGLRERAMALAFHLVAQPTRDGALPSLYAAMAPGARGGGYYGPTGIAETRGMVGDAQIMPQATDPVTGARLWALSEQLTGTSFA